MTPDEEAQCQKIIHAAAAAAGAGNLIPVPGAGIAADMVVMTAMTISLAAVFGGSLPEEAAKGLVITTIKSVMLKQPLRTLAKELSKLIPGLGQIVAPAMSVVMIEAAGWALAKDMERKFSSH